MESTTKWRRILTWSQNLDERWKRSQRRQLQEFESSKIAYEKCEIEQVDWTNKIWKKMQMFLRISIENIHNIWRRWNIQKQSAVLIEKLFISVKKSAYSTLSTFKRLSLRGQVKRSVICQRKWFHLRWPSFFGGLHNMGLGWTTFTVLVSYLQLVKKRILCIKNSKNIL